MNRSHRVDDFLQWNLSLIDKLMTRNWARSLLYRSSKHDKQSSEVTAVADSLSSLPRVQWRKTGHQTLLCLSSGSNRHGVETVGLLAEFPREGNNSKEVVGQYRIMPLRIWMVKCIQVHTIFGEICHCASFLHEHVSEGIRGSRFLRKFKRKINNCYRFKKVLVINKGFSIVREIIIR